MFKRKEFFELNLALNLHRKRRSIKFLDDVCEHRRKFVLNQPNQSGSFSLIRKLNAQRKLLI